MTELTRRYDIDWLRVIAIALLIVYHIGISFQPWGVFLAFIQNEDTLQGIWPAMAMLNIWRIPLLFFVSGMGVCFAMRKRNWKKLLGERTRRILIPLLFGSILIVPLYFIIWQKYYNQDISYKPSMGHLWFLANIFIYVLILMPLFNYLKNKDTTNFSRQIKKVFSSPFGILVILISFIIEALVLSPESFETYFNSIHGFALGFLAFLFGFLIIYAGHGEWETMRKWKWILLPLAIALFLTRWLVFDLKQPIFLYPIESLCWIFSAFGFAYQYLNKPSRVLSYLSRAAYPVYILHMIFLYLGSYIFFPIEFNPWVKFPALIIFTSLGCFLSFELVKRIKFIRPLFGLKLTE